MTTRAEAREYAAKNLLDAIADRYDLYEIEYDGGRDDGTDNHGAAYVYEIDEGEYYWRFERDITAARESVEHDAIGTGHARPVAILDLDLATWRTAQARVVYGEVQSAEVAA